MRSNLPDKSAPKRGEGSETELVSIDSVQPCSIHRVIASGYDHLSKSSLGLHSEIEQPILTEKGHRLRVLGSSVEVPHDNRRLALELDHQIQGDVEKRLILLISLSANF